MPINVQDATRHLSVDTFLLYDSLHQTESDVSHTIIVAEQAFPSTMNHTNARIVKLKE